MGKVVKFYGLVALLFGLCGLGAFVCGFLSVSTTLSGDAEGGLMYFKLSELLDVLEIVFFGVIVCLVWQQRRAWVERFGTGENPLISCLISWFCFSCTYGQLGGHKDSQPNVIVV